ncbi:MAG: hypothetical protein KJZ96_15545 [Rhodocyclaceae bacterium]|nr:hypothetical protein [Rhodocyclaceae bacterium]
MDFSSLVAAKEGVGAICNGVKALLDAKEFAAVHEKLLPLLGAAVDANGKLLDVQTVADAAHRRIRELEAEVAALKDWEEDKRRYRLHEVVPGTFVYRVDPAVHGAEPVHELCPNCYQKRVKSILQRGGVEQQHRTLRCPECGSTFLLDRIEAAGYTIDPEPLRSLRTF